MGTMKVNQMEMRGMIYIIIFMLAPAWPILGLFFMEITEESSAVRPESSGMITSQFQPPCQGRLGVPERSIPRKPISRDWILAMTSAPTLE